MITIKIGDIFESDMQVLVNTINCVGVMGKGIAKIFKEKYPIMFNEYKDLCNKRQIKTGVLYPYYENNTVKIINFPTKVHWRSPSKLEYITSGLNWFVNNYKKLGIKSIAFPPLGCGNGGLEWEIIGPIMYNVLKDIPIDIEIYAPYGTTKSKLSIEYLTKSGKNNEKNDGIKYKSINDNWLLVLHLVKYLEESKYSIKVGRVIFQKICFILSRYGTDLNISFSKGIYGPYSSDIKQMITILSNNNLIHEKEIGNMILLTVDKSFKLDTTLYSKKDKENINKTFHLFKRIKDTNQAELITTIIYSFDQLSETSKNVTENMIYDYIVDWKKRYTDHSSETIIRELCKSLTHQQLINVDYTKDFKYDLPF